MTLKPCPGCGNAAEIRTTKIYKLYSVRAICTGCGKRGKQAIDTEEPAAGAASIYWAALNWNCGLFEEQEGKA